MVVQEETPEHIEILTQLGLAAAIIMACFIIYLLLTKVLIQW